MPWFRIILFIGAVILLTSVFRQEAKVQEQLLSRLQQMDSSSLKIRDLEGVRTELLRVREYGWQTVISVEDNSYKRFRAAKVYSNENERRAEFWLGFLYIVLFLFVALFAINYTNNVMNLERNLYLNNILRFNIILSVVGLAAGITEAVLTFWAEYSSAGFEVAFYCYYIKLALVGWIVTTILLSKIKTALYNAVMARRRKSLNVSSHE